MKNLNSILDPQLVRSRIFGKSVDTDGEARRDGGFSLIEIMAGMAIIAILALAILPQFSKYFERAAVQNVSSEITNAALLAESDFSLTGSTLYDSAKINASITASNKSVETTFVPAVVAADKLSYTFSATSTAVKNYCLKYNSGGTAPGLKIDKKTGATCP